MKKKLKKPRAFTGKEKHAFCSPAFQTYEEKLPAVVYVNCDELNLKQTKALIKWLRTAVKWLEKANK